MQSEKARDGLLRFTLTRVASTLFIFRVDDDTKVEFGDVRQAWAKAFDVVDAPNHFSLVSKGSGFPATLSSENNSIMSGDRIQESNAFWRWTKPQSVGYRVVGRLKNWICPIYTAFHLYSNDRRIAYWEQPTRYGDSFGVFRSNSRKLEVATIAFSAMYDWDNGGNWSQ
ncbi:MAG: hypothetical protein AAF802_32595 [Planctomycetota bacterium]